MDTRFLNVIEYQTAVSRGDMDVTEDIANAAKGSAKQSG